ncbi:hypothetical protein ACQKO5_15585 [Novosphingobium subterraneum]|uniref:hypothetical protein n=1 Tax=Novosphingobium subterraneum TaxID=48936 RepID=UPI003CFC9764
MRKTVIAVVLSALVAGVATPALAHDNDRYRGGNRVEASYLTPSRNADVRRDIWELDSRIDRAQANRAISVHEAKGLRRELRDLKTTYTRFANRGLSPAEYRSLQNRVAGIHQRLHAEKWDRDGRRG